MQVRKAGSYAEVLLHFRPSKLQLRTRRDDGATLQLLQQTGRSWSVIISVPIKHAQFGGHFDCEMHPVVLSTPMRDGCVPIHRKCVSLSLSLSLSFSFSFSLFSHLHSSHFRPPPAAALYVTHRVVESLQTSLNGAVIVVSDTGCPLVTKAEVSQQNGAEGTIVLNSRYSLWVSEQTPRHLRHLQRGIYSPIAATSYEGGLKLLEAIEANSRVAGKHPLDDDGSIVLVTPSTLRVRVRSKRCKSRRKSGARPPG